MLEIPIQPSRLRLRDHWQLQSSEKLACTDFEVSLPGFDSSGWYSTSIPVTVLGALVRNGVFQNPFFGRNLMDIPGEHFQVPWWFRTSFFLEEGFEHYCFALLMDGINYRADMWINGFLVCSSDHLQGAYRRFELDISSYLKTGQNVLSFKVLPPVPGEPSIGYVDWNPPPPDRNMGIFRDITLVVHPGVTLASPSVTTKFRSEKLEIADLRVACILRNWTNQEVTGVLAGNIGELFFQKQVILQPGEELQPEFLSNDFPQLTIENPRVWWPAELGDPYLYAAQLEFQVDQEIADSCDFKVGIREVDDYVNDWGHRGFKINGKKILVKGAGWTDDLFLEDTSESIREQVLLTRHLNLNCIRLEGIWGKDRTLYELCDEYGILLMVGWSCHWEHEGYLGKPVDERFGGIFTEDEISLISQSWEDQLLWLRNHPSIFVWTVASDKVPHPDLEESYIQIFNEYDISRPYLSSTGGIGSEQGVITNSEIVSDISGSSRVKMLGPYDYTPPVYWYTDRNLGGAYGFNTETGPGAQIPVLDSIREMIPEDHLWPIDEVWNFHCGLNEFVHLDRFIQAMNARLGEPASLEEFSAKAQLLNYELIRPMFEAFRVNHDKSTGIIQWMLNAAWPKFYWQLYDWYRRPNAAFYGTRVACTPLQAVYDYGKRDVVLLNDSMQGFRNLKVYWQILDLFSNSILIEEKILDIEKRSSVRIGKIPEFNEISETYFLSIGIMDENNRQVASNLYWLSTKDDILDYEADVGSWAFYTPSKAFADFQQLALLPETDIAYELDAGFERNQTRIEVNLNNIGDKLAFFLEIKLVDAFEPRRRVPAFWSDNFISLGPHESRSINAVIPETGSKYGLEIQGWNIKDKRYWKL